MNRFPEASTATPRGDKGADVAGPPSQDEAQGSGYVSTQPLPATVVMMTAGELTAGATVRLVCAEVPLYVAVIVTVWLEMTVPAEMVNVAEVVPAGTVTVTGTDAALELDDSETAAPPEGAGAESMTLPLTVPPLATEFEDSVRL